MAFVSKTSRGLLNFKHSNILIPVRNHWNKHYKPNPYPRTEKEREEAAHKYNLNIQEYHLYPDDGQGLGDYPKLPDISGDKRDNFYPWDNPAIKHNFNEAIHADEDLISEDRYDVSAKHRVPFWSQWGQLFGVLGGCFAVMLFMERCKMFPAVYPRQYPNKEHYTFEIVTKKRED